jgi:hypothetical protein
MTSTLTPETNLDSLSMDELLDEWCWLCNQPETPQILKCIRKCEDAIVLLHERWEEVVAPWV